MAFDVSETLLSPVVTWSYICAWLLTRCLGDFAPQSDMSGLEVVGVVLGAIPLVISALEHYAEAAATVRIIRRAAQEFRTVARKLEAEHLIFRNALTNLLDDCTSIKPETLKVLLHNLDSSAWKDSDVEVALSKRLGGSLKSYREHVQSISAALRGFKERLHLNDDGQVRFLVPQ